MRRLARILRNLLFALTLLLFALAIALWLGLKPAPGFWRPRWGDFALNADGFGMRLFQEFDKPVPGPPPNFRTIGADGKFDGGYRGNPEMARWESRLDQEGWLFRRLGFRASREPHIETPLDTPESDSFHMGWIYSFTVPCWAVVVLTAPPTLLLIRRMHCFVRRVHDQWARRQRQLAGCCPGCGYDLRATPNRCPECGHPAQQTKPC